LCNTKHRFTAAVIQNLMFAHRPAGCFPNRQLLLQDVKLLLRCGIDDVGGQIQAATAIEFVGQ
jgi:hypothetical protein